MTDKEIFSRVADMLDITDRANYDCFESLAEELQDEIDDATEEQHYAIADQVEQWWAAQD